MDTKRYSMLEYGPAVLDGMENRAEYIAAVLDHCKPWLKQEVKLRHYKALADFHKSAYGVWKDIAGPTLRSTRKTKMDITEILRRSERAVFQVVREGQEHGEIGRQGELGGWVTKQKRAGLLNLMTIEEATGMSQERVQELRRATGVMDDDSFEAALAQGRERGEMSRSWLARVAVGSDERQSPDWIPDPADRTAPAVSRRRAIIAQLAREGQDSRQMQKVLGTGDSTIRHIARTYGIVIPADRLTARTKHIQSDNIVAKAVSTLQGVAMSLDMADVQELDGDIIRDLRLEMARAMRKITAYMADMRTREENDREYANSNHAGA